MKDNGDKSRETLLFTDSPEVFTESVRTIFMDAAESNLYQAAILVRPEKTKSSVGHILKSLWEKHNKALLHFHVFGMADPTWKLTLPGLSEDLLDIKSELEAMANTYVEITRQLYITVQTQAGGPMLLETQYPVLETIYPLYESEHEIIAPPISYGDWLFKKPGVELPVPYQDEVLVKPQFKIWIAPAPWPYTLNI